MSADRELLELAAKAAGSEIWTDADGNLYTGEPERLWDPLADDGDALRLAVRLDIQIWRRPSGVEGIHRGSVLTQPQTEPLKPDPYAATRRAIVRAAAEIGRSL
jgi:hypothetical protein